MLSRGGARTTDAVTGPRRPAGLWWLALEETDQLIRIVKEPLPQPLSSILILGIDALLGAGSDECEDATFELSHGVPSGAEELDGS